MQTKSLVVLVAAFLSVFVTASPIPVEETAVVVARDTVDEVAREPICVQIRC